MTLKNVVKITLVVMLVLTFAGCRRNKVDPLAEVEQTLVGLFPEDAHFAFGSVRLPTAHPYVEGDIVWTSSDDSIMTSRGVVRYGQEPKTVTLTAEALIKGQEHTFVFDFSVAGLGSYREIADYINELEAMVDRYPNLAELAIIGESHEGRPIYALEISANPGVNDGRPESVHTAQIHGREWPSGEAAMNLAWYLLENYGIDERVSEIVDSIRTFILPMQNPDGVAQNWTEYPDWYPYSSAMWRKNRTPNQGGSVGTDLNRNFPYQWGSAGSVNQSSNVYYGTGPLSEPETQTYADFALNRDFVTALHGHTFLEVIYAITRANYATFETAEILGMKTGYEVRGSHDGGGGENGLLQSLLGAIAFTFEYGKEFVPPYEGYGAPAISIANRELIETQHMKHSSFVREDLTGKLIDCGFGGSLECAASIEGEIAFIERGGGLLYQDKYDNAVAAGAKAIIIYNNEPHIMRLPLLPTGGDIPALVIGGSDADEIKAQMVDGIIENVELIADFFVQDSFKQVWERNLDGLLYMIETAKENASGVHGTLIDANTGEPLSGIITKEQVLISPLSGPREGDVIYFDHITEIEANGDFTWHMAPTVQPFEDSNSAYLTAYVEGYEPLTLPLELTRHRQFKDLQFALQPHNQANQMAMSSRFIIPTPIYA